MAIDARQAGLSEIADEELQAFRHKSVFVAAVFGASIPVALVAPDFAPLLWLALFLDPADRLPGRRGAS